MALEEVLIRSSRAASDFLALRAEPWDDSAGDYYDGPDVAVELSCGELHAESVLPAYIADAERLAPLFRAMDQEWRGWQGEKAAGEADRDWLSVTARHDGRGHVTLTVRLAEGWPMDATWSVVARIAIDIGSVSEIARSLEKWTDSIWPREHRWREPMP